MPEATYQQNTVITLRNEYTSKGTELLDLYLNLKKLLASFKLRAKVNYFFKLKQTEILSTQFSYAT